MAKADKRMKNYCGICGEQIKTTKKGFQICRKCFKEIQPKRLVANYPNPVERSFRKKVNMIKKEKQEIEKFKQVKRLIKIGVPIWVLSTDSTPFFIFRPESCQ